MGEEREIKCFEDIGAHDVSTPENAPRYNFRDLYAYARSKGLEPIDLTDEEREQFRTN
ncbi:hypothetical protein [Granulicatella seriolae]|uniref:Uncharacterized protein n=1 Tax=Granulicatella seriolae TaxID=2967226 RepID=A0ABT1WQN5_9LACT|nr:hypothetical protein [Granulicatella seriolae]